jgi:flagellar M-ring protein FliF
MISVVSAPFDMPAPPVIARDSVLPPADMLSKLQANPKPIVAIAALVVLLVIAVVSVSALKPKKSQRTAGDQPNLLPPNEYPQLPASSAMQSAMQETTPYEEDMVELPKRPIRLPPQATTPEREQAIATVEQRPDAAVRVVRTWLRS